MECRDEPFELPGPGLGIELDLERRLRLVDETTAAVVCGFDGNMLCWRRRMQSADGPLISGAHATDRAGRAVEPGVTLQLVAYAFAATFRLRDLSSVFPGTNAHDKDCLVARLDGGELNPETSADGFSTKLAVLFDFGAVVLIGVDAAERERIIQSLSARLSPEPHPPLTEDFLVEVRPGARAEVHFDRVILSEPSVKALKLISLLLAQSVAMDYYDEDVGEIQRRSDTITRGLQSEGRLSGRFGDLVRFIGSCMETKNGVIATMALFDKPDSTWEDADLDRLYRGLRHELEIDDRYRALEARLRVLQENLVLLVDLAHSRSTWRLELTVVVLILVEVMISLWQIFTNGRAH